jgi:DNA-binding NarL/FixJ family response regulator
MSFWLRLLNRLGLRRDSVSRQYLLDEQLHTIIMDLAQQEQRSEEEIHTGLLTDGLAQHNISQSQWGCWNSLSSREQEVTALTCLGYTNSEIASRLGVSPTTIKTHIRNILTKFQMHGKAELRLALQEWDFREWDRVPHN